MVELKGFKVDVIDYMYGLPYAVSFSGGRKIAVIDLLNTKLIFEKSFWKRVLGEHYRLLDYILKNSEDGDVQLLTNIVDYYFSDLILRKLSYIPDYVKYSKLVEGTVEGELITDDVWNYHILYLRNLREKSRVTLNNKRISTKVLISSIRKINEKNEIDDYNFRKVMMEFIMAFPEVIAKIIKYIPQDKMLSAIPVKELKSIINLTLKQLIKLEQNLRFDSELVRASREAVYYVHKKYKDELKEFKIIRHLMDDAVISSLSNIEIYDKLNYVIKIHITLLNEFKKSLVS